MVKIDFRKFTSFAGCPIWWQNFVTCLCNDAMCTNIETRNRLLSLGISKFNGRIIDLDLENVAYLEFDTDEDFNAFKLIWAIHGK